MNEPPQQSKTQRLLAEAVMLERAAQSFEVPGTDPPDAARKILHELRVHQVELDAQNEELRCCRARATCAWCATMRPSSGPTSSPAW